MRTIRRYISQQSFDVATVARLLAIPELSRVPLRVLVAVIAVGVGMPAVCTADAYSPPQVIVPEGFVAELAAAPPLLKHPLMAGFDERGRLFIAESAGKNLKRADLEKELPNFIRMLEDTNGDGVFDKSTIFADKMTMPQGALWYRGALYVCSSGGLWRLEDTDDDGVADKRKMIVGGFGYTGNAADIHGPFLAPTGRLVWCDGRHGHEFRDAEGKITSKGKAARIFSCRPDGSDVQTHCGGGMDNPVEVDFLPTGEMLGTVNLFYRQRGDCLVHWVRGGVYPRYDQPDCLAEFPSTGDPLTEVHNYGHVAVSGCTRYRSGEHGFGKQYADNFFVTQFNTHKVVRTVLTRSGGTFTAETHDFLHSESGDFHPTDVLEDADGSLLVIDTGGWFRIGCPTSQIAKPNIHGAIWRIRKEDGHTLQDPRGSKIDWRKQSPMDLLADDRFAVRERAIEECSRRYHRVADRFPERMLDDEQPETVRQNVVWALARMTQNLPEDHPDEDHEVFELALRANSLDAAKWIARATGDASPEVRIAAWHAVAHSFVVSDAIWGRNSLARMKDSLAEMCPAAAAMGSQRTGFHAIATQLDYAKTPLDRTTEHALIHALISIGQPKRTLEVVKTDSPSFPSLNSPRTKRAMLVALDQMPNGNLQRETVLRLIDSENFALRSTALAIMASHPEWSEGIEHVIEGLLHKDEASDDDLSSLNGLLVAFLKEPAVQSIVGEALASGKLDEQRATAVLVAMGQLRGQPWPMTWHNSVQPYLSSENPKLRLAAVSAVADAGVASLSDELEAIVEDRKPPLHVRIAAAVGLAQFDKPLGDVALDLMIVQLDADDAPSRLEAARAIGHSRLNARQLKSLVEHLAKLGGLELASVVGAFSQSRDVVVGLELIDAIKRSPGRRAISPARLAEIIEAYPPQVKAYAEAHLPPKLREAENDERRLTQLLANSDAGDVTRGREVFFGRRAACASCHRVGDDGSAVGPDLTTVGARRDRRDLLEAIALPSASIARGFETYSFVTERGKIHAGMILRQTPAAIQVRTMDQNVIWLPRDDIEEISPHATSIMPTGLDETLSAHELSDLVAYLQSLK